MFSIQKLKDIENKEKQILNLIFGKDGQNYKKAFLTALKEILSLRLNSN